MRSRRVRESPAVGAPPAQALERVGVVLDLKSQQDWMPCALNRRGRWMACWPSSARTCELPGGACGCNDAAQCARLAMAARKLAEAW